VQVIDLIADGSGQLDPGPVVDDLDMLGVSASSLSWAAALVSISHVRRRRPDLFIVAGGVHVSLFDQWVMEHSSIDAVVRGDGEHALLSLCAARTTSTSLADVPSLTWRDGDTVRRNAAGPAIERIDLTRWMPRYDELPPRAYFGLALETSRGCAYSCTFCSTPHKGRWRGGEADAVVDRIEALVPSLSKTITNSIYIVDDEFTMNPGRARDIADRLTERELPVGLLYDSRATDLTRPGLVESLAPHTRSLLVGAECGYDDGLRRVGKGTTCASLRAAAEVLHREGIAKVADFSFILGLPWETPSHIKATLDFGFALAADFGVRLLFNWYAQIPGSELWAQARARGAIHEARYDQLGVQRDPTVFFQATRLTPDEVAAAVSYGRDLRDELSDGIPAPELARPVAMTRPMTVGRPVTLATTRPFVR
jgi:radical SAM superfamily enzyme YgiQ (UPF0313 family)